MVGKGEGSQERPHLDSAYAAVLSRSEELKLQEVRARAMLEEITQRHSEFSCHTSKSFWARKGDRMYREFFRTHGQRSTGEQIRSLRAPDGSIRIGPEQVMDLATDYYRTLFQQEPPDPRARRCMEEVWRHTPTLVQPSMRETLLTPFTITEMQNAVRDIDGQKCPDEDGLSKAFFTTFWEQVH